jgi:uncharacterized protein (DUF3820 family)
MLENQQFLLDVSKMKMPYGAHKGIFLIDLPEHYIVWYHNKGFPKGRLGQMLGLVYELQLNGLEYLIREIQKRS